MKWRFLNTGASTGKINMDYDFSLAQNAKQGECTFRLYRWNPYCISLGANQDFDSINFVKANRDGIDIVKRPTGGRAILHSEELTYSVIYPIDEKTSARNIYHEINLALKKGLQIYDERLSGVNLESSQPDFQKFYKEEISAVCFAVPAKGELKFESKKLVGSAQRKLGNAILQHGSILCGGYHKNVVKYLNLSAEKISSIENEIDKTTTDIMSILSDEINYDKLSAALLQGFEEHFLFEIEETRTHRFIEDKSEIVV